MRLQWLDIQCQDHVEPALGGLIEIAARVGDEGTIKPRTPNDRRWIAVEGVEVGHALERRPGAVVDVHHVVDRLQDEAVANAQTLIGRFDGELVPAIGQALLAMVEAVETGDDLQGRCRGLGACRLAVA